ncbi:alpha/beta hydrolase [Rhodobacteraceae bacterium F11138]|nr:alpha/beta hydrolase [Rhodobacteraceae bacterium F11138]
MTQQLDPELLDFLRDQAAQAAANPDPTLEELRAGYREGYRARSPQPVQACETRDIALPTGASMRLYTPANLSSDAVILYAHGGGFALGCVDTYDRQSHWLAEQTGQRLVSLDYRLAPEHRFPAPVEDAQAAFDRITSDGLAPAHRIVLAGDSAGGCLCLVTALLAVGKGQVPGRVVSLYPVTDMTLPHPDVPLAGSMKDFAQGYYLEAEEMQWFRAQYLPEGTAGDWRASVVNTRDLSGLPPTWIVNARADPLFDQGRDFARLLSQAGVEAIHEVHHGVVHNFMEHTQFSPSARKAAAAVARLLVLPVPRSPKAP